MAQRTLAREVADVLLEMGVESVTIETQGRSHPRIVWSDRGGTIGGRITVPSGRNGGRSVKNNIVMARRLVRQAREGAQR